MQEISPAAPFFRDIALVFIAALAGGTLAQILRQPLLVGYIIGGLLISPFTPGPAIQDVRTFELFAQIGVVLLMFSIGIEFSLHEITRLGASTVLGAPATMALLIMLTMAVGALVGWPVGQSAAVGAVISVASTTVIVKLLLERGEVSAPHAKLAVGTTLMEDLVTVALFVLLPVLAGAESGRLTLVPVALARAALVLIPFAFLANRAIPRALERVARAGSTEMFVLVAMAIGVGTAVLSSGLGLSLALGAFLGGLIISESEFTHEVLTRILPIRDLFGALFFVSVGTLIRPGDLTANFALLGLLLALILLGKFGVRALVLRGFGYPWPTAALVSVHMAQTGEFSFVLAQVARSAGLIGDAMYHAILAASLLSILMTAVFSSLAHRWIEEPRMVQRDPLSPAVTPLNRVLICGYGRVGGTIGEALESFGIPYTVVDLDFKVVQALWSRGIAAVYGDTSSAPVLRGAGAERADLAVVATPDFERTRLAVRRLREIKPSLEILARSEHIRQRRALIDAGASEVIQPEFEAAQTLIRHSLERLGVSHEHIKLYMDQQRLIKIGDPTARAQAPSRSLLETKSVRIGPGFCADASLRQARIVERTGAWVASVRRADGTELANPGGDTFLREGDEVTVVGLPDHIALFETLNRGEPEPPSGR